MDERRVTDHLKVLGGDVVPAQDFDALRQRAALGLEKALGFVEAHGNELSKMRARILVEIEPVDSGLSFLVDRQAKDGSFAPLGEVFPGPLARDFAEFDAELEIVGSLEAVSVLSDWKRLYDEPCDGVVEYLCTAQRDDGGYGVPSAAPPDSLMRVFATGMLAGFLGRTRTARPEIMQAAGLYMNGFWSVDFIRQHGWPAVAAFAHYFTNVHDEEGEAALPWCSRELERGALVGEYNACQQLRILFYCEAEALPGVEFDTNALLDQLLNEQLEDGSCPAIVGRSDKPRERVATTLDAMMFMLRLCQARGQ